MLDILLSRLKEEIAIDGEEGVDITTVWEYTTNILKELTKSASNKEPTVDDKYKAFLWPHLKRVDSLGFYKRESNNNNNKKAAAAKSTAKAQTKPTQKGKRKKKQVDSDEEYGRDDCSEEDELEQKTLVSKDVKYTKIEVKDMDYHQLVQDYGDNISVIASKELQEKQMYKNVPPVVFPPGKQIEALQVILRQRSKGIYQSDLAKVLDVDPRSVAHYVKSLEEKGAVFRVPISIKASHTNLCTHVRFKENVELDYASKSDQKPYNVNKKGEFITQEKILETIIALGKGAANNMLITRDVLYALGFESNSTAVKKWFNRSVNELSIKGYVKMRYTQVDGKGLLISCVEVLQPAFEMHDGASKDRQELASIKYPLMIEGTNENGPGFCLDTTIHHQVFKIIEDSGLNGTSKREFELILNCDASRLLNKYMERIIDNSSDLYPSLIIKRHFEFQGRRRQFRYFTLENYNSLVEKKETELIPFPETEWDESTLREVNVLKPIIRTRKNIISTSKDMVSSYYKNLLASKRKRRPADDESQSDDDTSISEETPTKKPSRATRNTRGQKNDKEKAAQSDIASVSTGEEQQLSTKPGRSSRRNLRKENVETEAAEANSSSASNSQTPKKIGRPSKKPKTDSTDKEDSRSGASFINSATSNKRQTRSQNISENVDTEMTIETPTSSSNSQPETDAMKETPISSNERETTTNSSQEKIKHNNQPVKQPKKQAAKKTDKKQKNVTQQRTLVDYFGKVSKKQKTASTTDITQDTSSSTPTNKITSESNENIIDVDNMTPNAVMSTDHIEKVDTVLVTSKNGKEIPTYESEIVVAEAGPSSMDFQLSTQQYSSNTTETNNLANPTQIDVDATTSTSNNSDSMNTHTSESTDLNTATNKPVNTATDVRPSTAVSSSSKTTSSSSPSVKRGNVNSYSELRKSVLMDVVDQYEIVEVGKEMRRMFEEAHERRVGKKPSGTVCLKTLWKTCLDLTKIGEAQTKIIEYTMLNGKKVARKLLVRKDIDLEGEKFTEHVDLMKATRTVMKPQGPALKLERYEAPIERLQDRISKMKGEILEKSDISQPETFKMVAKLSEYADNASKSVTGQIFFKYGRDAAPKRSFWMITSMNHGWLYGRMLRVKALYMYLFNLLNRPVRIQGVDKEKRIMTLQSIVYNLPCSTFCQIIIIPNWTDEIKAYVDNPENADKTYEDFPQSVREVFFDYSSQFTKTLRGTLSFLIFLGLVVPRGLNSDRDQMCHFSEMYELAAHVEVWDFRLKPEFAQKTEYNLETEEDANNYWKYLHYIAIQAPPKDNDQMAEYSDRLSKECVKSMFNSRSWDSIAILTKAQRTILSSYVNKYKNYTPISNLSLCRKIAQEAEVPVNAVRNYYSKIQEMLDKKLEIKNAKRIEREANGNTVTLRNRKSILFRRYRVNGGTRIINRQTKHIFGSLEQRVIVPKNAKDTSQIVADEASCTDNMNGIPVIDGEAKLKYKRAKRNIWTKQQDDLLLYCYVILQQRASHTRFMWYAIRQVLPDKKTAACRARIAGILMKPFNQEYMSKCKALWKTAYKQGLESGEFVDDDPNELINFDLISQLEYFLKRIKSDLNTGDEIVPLPDSASTLNEQYYVHDISVNENNFHELVYHKKASLISRIQTMYRLSYTIRSTFIDTLDYSHSALRLEDDVKGRETRLIMSYCMMILLTPQEKYDPFLTYKSLATFDEVQFKKAVNNLKNAGFTVSTKTSRVIPGTKFNLSAKFLQKMANIYPKLMFEQSKEYETYLAQAGRIQVNPLFISSGMMSCMLDLVSRDKLDITMTDDTEKHKARIESTNMTRLLRRDLASFDVSVKSTENLDHSRSIDMVNKSYVYPLESATFEKQLSSLLSSLKTDKKELTQEIVTYMKERGSLGSIACELREHFMSYKETDIQYCLDSLLKADPPLLCLVGMDMERYVLTITKCIKSWVIFKDTSKSTKKDDQPPLFQNLIAIVPALWIDIEGDTTSVLFNDCCQTIIGWIISKPGVTASGLHRFLQNLITRVELNRILKHLVDQKVLRSVAVCQENNGKTGMFSKTRLSQVTKSARFRRNLETSYFVLPGYYNTLIQ